MLLATGGNETTAQLLSTLVLLLAREPEILDRLRVEPDLRPSAVEEVLRYISPVTGLFRHTTRDVDVAGTAVPADAKVLLLYGSANHDERQYDDPTRTGSTASPAASPMPTTSASRPASTCASAPTSPAC